MSDQPTPPRFPNLRGAPMQSIRPGRAASRAELYHRLVSMEWSGFFALLALAYVVFNLIFAGLYLAQPGAIANAKPGFSDAFFFSVQTMATIGYGDMHPATFYANAIVSVEVLLGMTGLACTTGVIFARFSRPTARVMFSRVALVTPYDGVPTLMFRAANQRRNRILEAQASVTLVRNEWTAEGTVMRRFYDLTLKRQRNATFILTWTVMHGIDATSPLAGATLETLRAQEAEIIVTLQGLDEGLLQTIHARQNYRADDILWNRRFVDIIGRTQEGKLTVDYDHFHDVEKIDS